MKAIVTTILVLLSFCSSAHAFTEVGLEGSFSRKTYGATRQNEETSKVYSANIAIYLFEKTALELNYMVTEEETVENTNVASSDETFSFKGFTNLVETEMYGIGIRQALASRKSFIRPLISIGYARQYIHDQTTYRYQITSTGETINISQPKNKNQYDSLFGTFSLQFRLTKLMSLTASVKTVFEAFEYSQAKDYLKYTLGLTWAF